MLHIISEKICQKLVLKNAISTADKPVISYGLEIIISTVGTTLCIFLLSCFLGHPVFCGLFIAFFMVQRLFVGGYHCTTYLRCFLTSLFLFVLLVLITLITPVLAHQILAIVLTTIALPIIYVKAPVLNPNNPLSKKRIARDRLIGRRIVVIQAALIIGLAFLLPTESALIYFCSLNYFLVTLMLFPKSA